MEVNWLADYRAFGELEASEAWCDDAVAPKDGFTPCAALTLRTYTHLMPSSEHRTRKAVERAFGLDGSGIADGPDTALEAAT